MLDTVPLFSNPNKLRIRDLPPIFQQWLLSLCDEVDLRDCNILITSGAYTGYRIDELYLKELKAFIADESQTTFANRLAKEKLPAATNRQIGMASTLRPDKEIRFARTYNFAVRNNWFGSQLYESLGISRNVCLKRKKECVRRGIELEDGRLNSRRYTQVDNAIFLAHYEYAKREQLGNSYICDQFQITAKVYKRLLKQNGLTILETVARTRRKGIDNAQFITAYLEQVNSDGTYANLAKLLGISKETARNKAKYLRSVGKNLPRLRPESVN